MLPELLISKFKSRTRSYLISQTQEDIDSRPYLHSRRRYLINSIPLLSIVALLVGVGINCINANSTYATTSTIGDSTASITLDTSDVVVNVVPGETGYASKSITVSTNNTESYALTITAPAVLKNESTNSTNPWSYAYGQSGELSTMSYTNFDGNTKELESGIESSGSTKTLAFSSTFAEGLASGHYKAEVILGLTATPAVVTYTVSYDASGGVGAPSAQSCEAEIGASCRIKINPDIMPIRTGFSFLGWNTDSAVSTADKTPGNYITLYDNATLYAKWKQDLTAVAGFSGITTMQQMTSSICSAAPRGAYKTLIDNRDNNAYKIMKLDDDRCWMTEDLRLTGSKNLTSADSDTTGFVLPAPLNTLSSDDFSANIAYKTIAQSYRDVSTNRVYYNWFAATAGAGNASMPTDGVTNAGASICPKGWSLPTGGQTGQFKELYDAMLLSSNKLSSDILMDAPYNFSYTGYVGGGKYYNPTEEPHGYWWSQTVMSSNNTAYSMVIYNSGVNYPGITLGSSGYRSSGYAIRCVAK